MAAQPRAKPHRKISAKAYAADVANLRKARAAEAGKPRTAKQREAARRNLVKARAAKSAQKARRAGKTPATAKQPKAAAPDTWTLSGDLGIHTLPACAAVAVAAHLAAFTGAWADDEQVLQLWARTKGETLAGVLEAAAEGFAGTRLAHFERADPDYDVAGLLYGLTLPGLGYHAALALPGGMLTWGVLIPRLGQPEEAWWLEWEGE